MVFLEVGITGFSQEGIPHWTRSGGFNVGLTGIISSSMILSSPPLVIPSANYFANLPSDAVE